jgi:hypothetical protein
VHRYIPWTDFLLYGGLAVVSVAAAIWAVLTPQDWEVGGVIAVILVPSAFVVLAVVIIGGKLLSRPDFVVFGMSVWMGDVVAPSAKFVMVEAIEVFVEKFPGLARKHGFDGRVQSGALTKMIDGVRCEWRSGKISMISRWGWAVKDKAGLQSGKSIVVQWRGEISESAFYHELGHMVREMVLNIDVDYKHEDVEWWEAVREVKAEFSGR